jgi:hypothetical protein
MIALSGGISKSTHGSWLSLIREYEDEGENHYFDASKIFAEHLRD